MHVKEIEDELYLWGIQTFSGFKFFQAVLVRPSVNRMLQIRYASSQGMSLRLPKPPESKECVHWDSEPRNVLLARASSSLAVSTLHQR
jgi:hypothetical protein